VSISRALECRFGPVPEIEHVEQIADRRAVHRQVGIVFAGHGVRQLVAAAAGKRREVPIALDEFQDRSVVVIAVHHMAAGRIGRHYDERNARSVTKKNPKAG
jgi:hypothetical protein